MALPFFATRASFFLGQRSPNPWPPLSLPTSSSSRRVPSSPPKPAAVRSRFFERRAEGSRLPVRLDRVAREGWLAKRTNQEGVMSSGLVRIRVPPERAGVFVPRCPGCVSWRGGRKLRREQVETISRSSREFELQQNHQAPDPVRLGFCPAQRVGIEVGDDPPQLFLAANSVVAG